MEVEPVLVVEPRHNAAVQRALQLNARATRTGSEVAAAPARVALPREWRVAAGSKVAWATMSDVEELRARGGNEADGRKAAVKAKFRLVVSLAGKKSAMARLLKERDAFRVQLRTAQAGLRQQEKARKLPKGAVGYETFLEARKLCLAAKLGCAAASPFCTRSSRSLPPPQQRARASCACTYPPLPACAASDIHWSPSDLSQFSRTISVQ